MNARRDTCNGLALGDILRDNRAGTDDRARSDHDAAHHDRAGSDRGTRFHAHRKKRPVVSPRKLAARIRSFRKLVVDEDDTVANEDLVPDLDTIADEAVALDLAASSDHGAP